MAPKSLSRFAGALCILLSASCALAASEPIYVLFTIDTESRSYADPNRDVWGELPGVAERHGVERMMDIFDRHGVKATFFANVFEANERGADNWARICRTIQQRGFDCELHTHPSPEFGVRVMAEANRALQTAILRRGMETLRDWTGVTPLVHRAGEYAANRDTPAACRDAGIVADFSYNVAWPACRLAEANLTTNAPVVDDGVLLVPVTVFAQVRAGPWKSLRFLDVESDTGPEILYAIDRLHAGGVRTAVVMLHSFSLVRFGRPNLRVEDELDSLLGDLKQREGVRIVTARELAELWQRDPNALAGADFVPTTGWWMTYCRAWLRLDEGWKNAVTALAPPAALVLFVGAWLVYRRRRAASHPASHGRIYARNLVVNWLGQGVNLIVLFLLSPFIVNTLGQTDYGIWSLLVTITGYMGVLDLGIRASTGRYIILYTGKGDVQRVNETIRTSLGFFSCLVTLLAVLGLSLGWLFPDLFENVRENWRAPAMILLTALAVNIWFAGASVTFSGVLAAHDRYDLVQMVSMGTLAVRTVVTVWTLLRGYGLYGLAAATVCTQVLELAANYALARRVFPQLAPWPLSMSRERLREMVLYGIAAFLAAVGYRIIHNTDLIVVGAMISVEQVTIYTIAGMLVLNSWMFVEQIGHTMFPPVQRAAARMDADAVHLMCLKQIRLSLIIGLPVYVGFIFFGREFISLWMGPKYASAAVVLSILSGARIASLFCNTLHSSLSAAGGVNFNMWMAMAEAAANLGLTIALVWFGCGTLGVALGTLAAMVSVRTLIYTPIALRRLDITVWKYVRDVVWRGVVAGLLIAAACQGINRLLPGCDWTNFVIEVLLAVAASVVVNWFVLAKRAERQRLWRFLRPGGAGATTN